MVVGSTRAAFSLALEACDAGLTSVKLVTESGSGEYPALASHPGVDIVHGGVTSTDTTGTEVVVNVDGLAIAATAVAVVDQTPPPVTHLEIPASIADRGHTGTVPDDAWDLDVLVVGGSEAAAETAISLAEQGTSVVLSRDNVDPRHLSRLVRRTLLHREAERRLTILWHSRPVELVDLEGEVMLFDGDTHEMTSESWESVWHWARDVWLAS